MIMLSRHNSFRNLRNLSHSIRNLRNISHSIRNLATFHILFATSATFRILFATSATFRILFATSATSRFRNIRDPQHIPFATSANADTIQPTSCQPKAARRVAEG